MANIGVIFAFSGFIVSYGYDDLSVNKTATQSTTIPCIGCPDRSYVASMAVDNDMTTCTRTVFEKNQWWMVDLLKIKSIYAVEFSFRDYGEFYRTRQQERLSGYSIYVSKSSDLKSGELCFKQNGSNPTKLTAKHVCVSFGRYIQFLNERSTFIELCNLIVSGCIKGRYGDKCNQTCPQHCKSQKCYVTNGTCLGCANGWTGSNCNEACSAGKFGPDCSLSCSGHCKNNSSCISTNGMCLKGCTDGWMGVFCNESCATGTFGPDCKHNCSRFCLNDLVCNRITGKCDEGCKPGYTGEQCNRVCTGKRYGIGCMYLCSQYCNNTETCNHVTGVCENGCADGYFGMQCNSTCSNGTYGPNCSKTCSKNCSGTCDYVDGTCTCKNPQMVSPECKTEVSMENKAKVEILSSENADESVTVGVSVGATIFFILLIISLILFVRYRNKSEMEKESIDSKGRIMLQKLENKQTSTKPSHSKSAKKDNTSSLGESTTSLVPHGQAKDPRGGLIHTKKLIPIKNLHVIVEKMTLCESAGFKNEYMEIKKGELYPCLEAKKSENVSKNRYKTTYAYDHSRVILSTLSSGSNYINANFIEDTQGQRAYVATQGPKSKTVSDFWSMVWQEKLNIIVCLTNLKEGEKTKCSQYWPNNGEQIRTGEFTIYTEKEIVYADYVIRTLRLSRKNIKTNMAVMMFHYTKWPDHGVPDPLSLVIFHRHVMRMSDVVRGKYILVHCSAGIGRTGTYIALDALYREGEKTGKVNVQKYVEIMRKDRMNMIQGSDQYEVVYLTLFESFRGKSECMSTESFLKEYQQHSCYSNSGGNSTNTKSEEFEELANLRKKHSKKDFESGHANITANYTPSILPLEEFRCYLDYVKNRGTYYNAVLLKSFTRNDALISAQYPLPDYTEDFLRLLTDFDVRVAVFLSPLRDISSSTQWFPFKKQTKTLGSFTVKFAESSNSNNINTTEILLKREGSGNIRRLAVVECRAWKDGLSLDHRALLDAIKETKIEKSLTGSRILILSNDGAKRCGPFCVVYNCLEQISLDNEFDMFTNTRLLQIRRPEFISTLDEYQFCHDVLAEYLQNDTVYANC